MTRKTLRTNRFRPVGAVASLCAALCALAPAAASAAPDDIVITNLRYGPVCGEGATASICAVSGDVPLTNTGHCVLNRQDIACTWYGFSFDYKLRKPTVELDCTWSSDVKSNVGDPTGIRDRGVSSGTFKLPLTNDQASFFNPQYTGAGEAVESTLMQSCAYEGRRLFEFTLRLHTVIS